MARRRQPAPRTSVVDGRAQIIVPAASITDPDGTALTLRALTRWMARVNTFPTNVTTAEESVAITLDRFAWDLHVADIGHATDTHDGDAFFDAATAVGAIDVYVVDGADPRRSDATALDAAARKGDMTGSAVAAFPVDVLDP